MPDRTELGLLLQQIRKGRGESLTSMAECLGITKAYLSAIELGKRRPPVGFADKVSSTYKLTHEERQKLYRMSSRDKNDVHRQILFSMIVQALSNYDDTFLLGLSMDLYPEEQDGGPSAVEVAVRGEGSHHDEDNNCFVYLDFLEVEILEHVLAKDLSEQRSYLTAPVPDDIDFEEWLDMTDYSRDQYRRCEVLFEKVTGHPYDPTAYEDELDDENRPGGE